MSTVSHTMPDADPLSYVMRLSRNGQVSIPAATRARWKAGRMTVVDMGDYLLIRPLSDDPIGDLMGKYAGLMPSTEEMRRQDRADDEERERRRR